MVPQGTVLRNAFNGETSVFSGPVDADDVARMDVELAPGGTGGGDALVHVHPLAEERFTVTRGAITVTIDGADHHLSEGDSIVVPRGRAHAFRNAGASAARLAVELTPARTTCASSPISPRRWSNIPAGTPATAARPSC